METPRILTDVSRTISGGDEGTTNWRYLLTAREPTIIFFFQVISCIGQFIQYKCIVWIYEAIMTTASISYVQTRIVLDCLGLIPENFWDVSVSSRIKNWTSRSCKVLVNLSSRSRLWCNVKCLGHEGLVHISGRNTVTCDVSGDNRWKVTLSPRWTALINTRQSCIHTNTQNRWWYESQYLAGWPPRKTIWTCDSSLHCNWHMARNQSRNNSDQKNNNISCTTEAGAILCSSLAVHQASSHNLQDSCTYLQDTSHVIATIFEFSTFVSRHRNQNDT